ncbi:hypothetical protein HanRHA438_Chr09g0411111 [Helianthus annuus]|nr:hypothetical protein HanRHA438_Chr09g0411111 [Helianthus annuus]
MVRVRIVADSGVWFESTWLNRVNSVRVWVKQSRQSTQVKGGQRDGSGQLWYSWSNSVQSSSAYFGSVNRSQTWST